MLAVTLGCALAPAACSLIYDVGRVEGPTDVVPGPDAPGAVDCPAGRGPTAARVRFDGGSFCIDTTEVTNAEFAAFLTAKGTDTSGQPAACAANTSYVPTDTWPIQQGHENDPVVYVDWCDARAFCQWAGKRLCGSRVDAFVTRDEWYVACSHDGARAYPYGTAYDPSACNGGATTGNLVPVGTKPGCVGGYDGLFDMSGNASEWVDACKDDGTCQHRGGAFYSKDPAAPRLSCSDFGGIGRLESYSTVGFRCCAD